MIQAIVNGIDVPAHIIATVIGLIMCLWGVQLSRFISSLASAATFGYLAYVYVYEVFRSIALSMLIAMVSALIGLLIGFTLFRIALSVLFSYMISTILLSGTAPIVLMTLILAVVVYVLSSYFIAALFVATGASIIYKSATVLGLQPSVALIIVILISILGIYNQMKGR